MLLIYIIIYITLYIYVSKDVRIRGYFSKQKEVRERRSSGNTALHTFVEGRNSVIIVPTRYGLDGPGFEPCWWGKEILCSPHLSIRTLGPTQFPLGIFPWGKAEVNNE